MSGATARIHPHLVEERDGAVTIVRVDRPEALGAFSRSMLEALGEHLETLAASQARVVVLTGTGRGFVAGADISEYHGVPQQVFDAYQRLARTVSERLAGLPQPTIAAVNGYAFGGGFELALCCDMIIASTAARFALPEVKLGLLPGGSGTQRLARALGVRLAKEMIMTGRVMRPGEAAGMGLLSSVVEPEQLLPAAKDLAATLAERAPLAVRQAKRVIDDGMESSLAAGWSLEQSVLSGLYATTDAQEGIQAFLDKRDPHFVGR